MEFFGDDRLARVGSKLWRGEVEHDRVLHHIISWLDSVAKPDVDFQLDTSARNRRGGAKPQASIIQLLPNAFYAQFQTS